MGLVSFGGEPSIVPEHLVVAIQHKLEGINAAGGAIFDGLKPGDAVWISEGPFKGYEAIFDERVTGSERVRVLLEFLGSKRKVPLTLHAGQIEQKKK